MNSIQVRIDYDTKLQLMRDAEANKLTLSTLMRRLINLYLTDESTLICTEVSRLSRSTQQLCEIVNIIKRKHMRLEIVGSITIDCRKGDIDPMSQAFIQMSAVFAELELSIIRARVKSGMANAKEKGRRIGRPHTTKDDIPAIFYKHYPSFASGQMNVIELARICGLSRPTVYKYLKMVG